MQSSSCSEAFESLIDLSQLNLRNFWNQKVSSSNICKKKILISVHVINLPKHLLLTYEFFKNCKKKFSFAAYKLFCHGMLTSARSEPDQNFQTSRSGHCQTWARSDNRTKITFFHIGSWWWPNHSHNRIWSLCNCARDRKNVKNTKISNYPSYRTSSTR